MSVYIRGMDMPKNCWECDMFINCDDCEGWECQCAVLGAIGYMGKSMKEKRRADCPLVEVPEHGRLIDRDAYSEKMRNEPYDSDLSETELKEAKFKRENLLWVFNYLLDRDAPTIIPADRVEEDEE